MIHLVDQNLKAWVQQVLGDIEISFAAPRDDYSDSTSNQGVDIYLLNLVHKPAATSTYTLPLEISLHYLVTTWASTIETAHQLLGELVFAALENSEFEVQIETLPINSWIALNRMPRPCFVLSIPLKRDRPQRIAPLVRVAPVLQTSPMQSLEGIVMGQDNIPIPGAYVEIPALRRTAETDTQGRFNFAATPVHPPIKQLFVRAKGRRFAVALEPAIATQEPLVIHLHNLEA
jgi:hypothetical protein